jgi:Protein of unknown function (DUF4197)
MSLNRIRLVTVLAVVLVVLLPAAHVSAQLDRLLKGLSQESAGADLSDAKIASGLREALRVGTQNAVILTSKTDGYFLNQAIKILMPEKLQTLEQGLRAFGYGSQVEELVLSMNRAAEQSAPAAKQIFGNAIAAMSFEDARKILKGPETAATDYFKIKTTDQLTTAFRPTVERSMSKVGVTRQYQELLGLAKAIPFLKAESYDLNTYVVSKALDGLFYVVADEERKIRTNPAARVTDLLKEVFAKR